MKDSITIRKWMEDNIDTYASQAAGRWIVADMTMARDACDYFFDYDERGNVPSDYFDIAYEVGKAFEKRMNRQ